MKFEWEFYHFHPRKLSSGKWPDILSREDMTYLSRVRRIDNDIATVTNTSTSI